MKEVMLTLTICTSKSLSLVISHWCCSIRSFPNHSEQIFAISIFASECRLLLKMRNIVTFLVIEKYISKNFVLTLKIFFRFIHSSNSLHKLTDLTQLFYDQIDQLTIYPISFRFVYQPKEKIFLEKLEQQQDGEHLVQVQD